MACTSAGVSSGVPHDVHGPRPSLAQTTLPQDRQLGAALDKGCLVATQLHFRDFGLSRVGFVEISSALMAASRSAVAVDCPAMGVPPDIVTFVLPGLGVELRDPGVDFDFPLVTGSEIKYPAEGFSFGCDGGGAAAGPAAGFGVEDLDASLLPGALAVGPR